MRNILFIIAFFSLTTSVSAREKGEKLYCDKSKSSITYAMHHPLHDWKGVSKDVMSVIVTDAEHKKITQVAASVKIASFDSKNANRDSHTIEVTEALKYPSITFSSTKIEQNGDSLKVTGQLTFHGQKKVISFTVHSQQKKGKFHIVGDFTILMTNFGIEPPSLMAIATDDKIEIEFDLYF